MSAENIISRDDLFSIVIELLEKYHAESALLFGSYARNEATPNSDIDLIIFGGAVFQSTDVFAIAEELHERTGKDVDVYEIQEINHSSDFYTQIMKDGVRVA